MLYYIILTVIVLICILLTIVVLLQPGQGGGISGGLAGGMAGGSGLGARRTADLLSKSTTVLATALLVLCVLANFAINRGGSAESAVQQGAAGVPPATQQQNDINNTSNSEPAVPLNQNQDDESNTNTNEPSSEGGN